MKTEQVWDNTSFDLYCMILYVALLDCDHNLSAGLLEGAPSLGWIS